MYQVRNGQQVAPTCPECGCRVYEYENTFWHYLNWLSEHRDARGHTCSLVNEPIEIPQKRDLTNLKG